MKTIKSEHTCNINEQVTTTPRDVGRASRAHPWDMHSCGEYSRYHFVSFMNYVNCFGYLSRVCFYCVLRKLTAALQNTQLLLWRMIQITLHVSEIETISLMWPTLFKLNLIHGPRDLYRPLTDCFSHAEDNEQTCKTNLKVLEVMTWKHIHYFHSHIWNNFQIFNVCCFSPSS